MMDNWNGGAWGWFAMAFMMLLFWGLIAGVVIVAIRSWGRRPEGSPAAGISSEVDPLRLLDTRFARGEIDAEEYTGRRNLLRGAVTAMRTRPSAATPSDVPSVTSC